MNLPKGPDTLCFDKDEFMKVRAGAPLLFGASPRTSARPLGGDLAARRSESLGPRLGGRLPEEALP